MEGMRVFATWTSGSLSLRFVEMISTRNADPLHNYPEGSLQLCAIRGEGNAAGRLRLVAEFLILDVEPLPGQYEFARMRHLVPRRAKWSDPA